MRAVRYPKKAQVLLTNEAFALLQQVAKRQKKKLGSVLREAFERLYVQKHRAEQVRSACAKLLQLEAPTTNWAQFESDYTTHKASRRG